MLHKASLIEEVKKGGYEASLISTFNSYLPFYEEVVLRRLVNTGVRHNVLMMDAGQYAASMHDHPPLLAGRHYSLVPIDVSAAFHPKLILLVGKRKGLVEGLEEWVDWAKAYADSIDPLKKPDSLVFDKEKSTYW